MSTQTGSVIYFPQFSPASSWLKAALLFWDRVYCIIPDSVADDVHWSGEHRAAIDADSLKAVSPRPYVAYAEQVFDDKLSAISASDSLREDILAQLSDFPERDHVKLSRDKHSGRFLLHIEKMSKNLLGRIGRSSSETWVMTSEKAGNLYMLSLATAIAEQSQSGVATDVGPLGDLGEIFVGERTRGKAAVRDSLVRVGVGLPDLSSVASCPMQSILAFRTKYKSNRLAFRDAVFALVERLGSASDPLEFESLVANARSDFAVGEQDYYSCLADLRVQNTYSLLGIGVPTLLGSVAINSLNLPTWSQGLVVGAGLTIAACAWWSGVAAKLRRLRREHPWQYAAVLCSRFGEGS